MENESGFPGSGKDGNAEENADRSDTGDGAGGESGPGIGREK